MDRLAKFHKKAKQRGEEITARRKYKGAKGEDLAGESNGWWFGFGDGRSCGKEGASGTERTRALGKRALIRRTFSKVNGYKAWFTIVLSSPGQSRAFNR